LEVVKYLHEAGGKELLMLLSFVSVIVVRLCVYERRIRMGTRQY
jgi:hypothetical protein